MSYLALRPSAFLESWFRVRAQKAEAALNIENTRFRWRAADRWVRSALYMTAPKRARNRNWPPIGRAPGSSASMTTPRNEPLIAGSPECGPI